MPLLSLAPILSGNRDSAALGLGEGDHVVFRVEGRRAVLARTPDLLELAGAVEVPAGKRGASWDEVRRQTRAARSRRQP